MTCEDCVHYEVCVFYSEQWNISMWNTSPQKCHMFKDKSKFIELPCRVGDKVYVISRCENISMFFDNDYFNGTGATECPFEDDCMFEDCDNNNIRILETCISAFAIDEDHKKVYVENLFFAYDFSDFGKTIFLTKEEAEKALKKRGIQEV